MSASRLRSIGITLVLAVLIFAWRWSRRSDDSAIIQAETMKLVSYMAGYSENRSVIDPMAERAHNVAFGKAYTMARRRKQASFDEIFYLDEFFKAFLREAELMNRLDLKTAILELQEVSRDDAEVSNDEVVDAMEREDAETANSAAAENGTQAGDASENPEGDAQGDPSADQDQSQVSASPRMSRAEFDATADDLLIGALYERIAAAMPSAKGETADVLKKLSEGQRAIYHIRRLETEMSNGGFEAYFDSEAGPMAVKTVSAFNSVGAKKHATLLRRAISVYARKNPDQETFKVNKAVKGYMKKYKKDKSLKAVDKDYFGVKENLEELCAKYARGHAEAFVGE